MMSFWPKIVKNDGIVEFSNRAPNWLLPIKGSNPKRLKGIIMDYKKVYTDFIADRRIKEPAIYSGKTYLQRKNLGSCVTGDYFEHHHIIPVKLGGDNSAENIISLTSEDHIHAHIILARVHGRMMWLAVKYIFSANKLSRVPTKSMIKNYAYAKKKHGEFLNTPEQKKIMSEKISGDKNPSKRPEVRQKMAAAQRGRVRPMDQRLKQSIATKGVKKSDSHRAALKGCQAGEKHAMHGKNHKDESKAKTSESLRAQGRVWITNGIENKVIKTQLGESAPAGWFIGRTKNFRGGNAPGHLISKQQAEIFSIKKKYAEHIGAPLDTFYIQRNIKINDARAWMASL